MYNRINPVLFFLIYNSFMGNCISEHPLSGTTRWKSYSALLNLNFTSNITWRKTSANVALCSRLCENDMRCVSFGYHSETKTCQGQSSKQYKPIQGSVAPGVQNFFPQGNRFSIETVSASSIYEATGTTYEPMFAIDGDTNTCFISEYETSVFPYFVAEWTDPISVTEVIIYKRPGTVLRFENVFVYIGMKYDKLDLCDVLPHAINVAIHRFVCSYPIKGNMTKIEHRGPTSDTAIPPAGYAFRILEIAEIIFYGF